MLRMCQCVHCDFNSELSCAINLNIFFFFTFLLSWWIKSEREKVQKSLAFFFFCVVSREGKIKRNVGHICWYCSVCSVANLRWILIKTYFVNFMAQNQLNRSAFKLANQVKHTSHNLIWKKKINENEILRYYKCTPTEVIIA